MNWLQYKPETPLPTVNGWIRNWFSNMVLCPITIDGITYASTENWYQAQKLPDDIEGMMGYHAAVAKMTPQKAKAAGRNNKAYNRPNWESVKYNVMLKGLRVKFAIPEWRDKLLATGDEQIIEWNNWGDRTWGVSSITGEGENLLGIALMQVREELKRKQDPFGPNPHLSHT